MMGMWGDAKPKTVDESDEDEEEEESSEEESSEDESNPKEALSREQAKAAKKARKLAAIAKQKGKAAPGDMPSSSEEEDDEEEEGDMPANPNHSAKARTQAATIAVPVDPEAAGKDKAKTPVSQLSRREREALQAQQAKEKYQKLHAEGKTDEARADLERLRLVRERREAEAARKKAEAEERDRLQERLKQERRRGIHHKYKDLLSSLSRRLKAKVATPEKGNDKDVAAQKLEQIRSLAALQQMCCFMMFLCTFIWLILVVVVGIHPELNVIGTNAVGLMFLIAFGFITLLQFFAAILHRLETMFNALANIPMTFDFTMVDEGKKFEKMMALKQQQVEGESTQRERVAAKVARKLLMVDKRTSTKANLFST